MSTKIIVLDVSELEKLSGKLITGKPAELKMIELYRYLHNEETSVYNTFTIWILQKIYNDEVVRPYSEITHFFRERIYISITTTFLTLLERLLFNAIDDEFIDINFVKFSRDGDKKLNAEFKVRMK